MSTTVTTNPAQVEPIAGTAAVAAQRLGISEFAVRRLVRDGKLRARTTGPHNGRYIISFAAIDEFLAGSDAPIAHADTTGRVS